MELMSLFDKGIKFKDFINCGEDLAAKKLKEKYDAILFDFAVINKIKSSKVNNILAFAEIWCPDCQVSLPIIAKICNINAINLSILNREGHIEDMEPFYVDGKARIPTYVFMDKNFDIIGTWIERSKSIKELTAKGDESWRIDYIKGIYDKEIINEFLEILSR